MDKREAAPLELKMNVYVSEYCGLIKPDHLIDI